MAASVLSVRVDSSIKDSFAELCEELGMTSSVAVNMFMRQMLRERSLPFVPSLGKSAVSESVAAGILDTAQIESAVREAASPISAIKTVILFGSYARGEARADSDIDLRIKVDRDQGFGLFALSAFGEAVRKETGKQVDLVSSDYLDDDFAAVIEHEGVVIYDRA
ncbi:type II toxin-antitoxin system RelB/DinJ family antitoxin [Collinsella aerofaciens]|uniref:type II toxin-antitoxin system RelB/DinJ family antitoxin n=1 Tax=Collinsella aerofaciens TaxID=74426 RepID=UPI00359C3F5F